MKRIVKLGGSLLDWPEWPVALRNWIRLQNAARTLVLVGGGAAVDAIRKIDTQCQLSSQSAHRASVRMMDLNTEVCADRIPEWPLVTFQADCLGGQSEAITTWVKAADWVVQSSNLEASWNSTSDSIAAALATAIGADEVVLLKSCLPPLDWRSGDARHDKYLFESLTKVAYVDANFHLHLPGSCQVRFVDLRSPKMECDCFRAG